MNLAGLAWESSESLLNRDYCKQMLNCFLGLLTHALAVLRPQAVFKSATKFVYD